MSGISFISITGIGEVAAGDDLAAVLWDALAAQGLALQSGDLLVAAHKIVSKAEGRTADLGAVTPTAEALRLAERMGKSPALVQLVLEESAEVFPCARGVLMSRHRLGWTCANAGVDQSNAPDGGAVLLPLDPDASARRLSEGLAARAGLSIPVLISDTHGRPLREGIIGVAVGCWGLEAVKSYVGLTDRRGHRLAVSREAVADELCSAATLCMGQGDESIPAVLVRGYGYAPGNSGSAPLKRDPAREFFRPVCEKEDRP